MLNFVLTAVGSWRLKNAPKLFSNNLKDNLQNQRISELYNDDNKSKYSR